MIIKDWRVLAVFLGFVLAVLLVGTGNVDALAHILGELVRGRQG